MTIRELLNVGEHSKEKKSFSFVLFESDGYRRYRPGTGLSEMEYYDDCEEKSLLDKEVESFKIYESYDTYGEHKPQTIINIKEKE